MSFVYRATQSQDLPNDPSLSSRNHQTSGDNINESSAKLCTKPALSSSKSKIVGNFEQPSTESIDSRPSPEQWMSLEHTIHAYHKIQHSQPNAQKPTSIFLSTTVRQILPKAEKSLRPGPGHYYIERIRDSKYRAGDNPNCSKVESTTLAQRSLCEYLNSSYTPVASIPSESRRLNKKDQSRFLICAKQEASQSEKENHSQIDCVSTGKKIKGTNFHISKIERKVFEPPKETCETDDTNNKSSLYLTDVCVGDKKNQPNKVREHTRHGKLHTINSNIRQSRRLTQQDSESSSEEEYIETTPGPGSYDYQTSSFVTKDFRSKKASQAVFLSQEQRLKDKKVQNRLGPTSYNVEYCRNLLRRSPKSVGFLAMGERFKPVGLSNQAEAGLYRPRNSIENDLVNELVKGLKGRFGTNVKRFDSDQTCVPGPGTYYTEDWKQARKEQEKSKLSYSYKSTVKRCLFDSIPNFPGPGEYQNTANEEAELSEYASLKPKQAPFNSSSTRVLFEPKFTGGEASYMSIEMQNSKAEQTISSPFKSKSPRFPESPLQKIPSVGEYYDQRKDFAQWETPTYNVLFRQI